MGTRKRSGICRSGPHISWFGRESVRRIKQLSLPLGQQLRRAADHYGVITGRKADADPAVQAALVQLRSLDSSTAYPLLLRLFARREAGTLSSPDLATCIRWIAGFIFFFFNGIVFAGVQFGIAVMRLTKDDSPPARQALRQALRKALRQALHLTPVKIAASAKLRQ